MSTEQDDKYDEILPTLLPDWYIIMDERLCWKLGILKSEIQHCSLYSLCHICLNWCLATAQKLLISHPCLRTNKYTPSNINYEEVEGRRWTAASSTISAKVVFVRLGKPPWLTVLLFQVSINCLYSSHSLKAQEVKIKSETINHAINTPTKPILLYFKFICLQTEMEIVFMLHGPTLQGPSWRNTVLVLTCSCYTHLSN